MDQTVNPLLARVKIPGKIFQLPSTGAFYTNGELDESVENGEVHVYPMTALDEITLKNPDMLFSGKAISMVFRHCIPEIKKPEELFSKDIDALMIFLRCVTYGQFYEIEATHSCENAKPNEYSVDLESLISNTKYLTPEVIAREYSTVLENGQVVKMQPVRYKHILQILKMNEKKTELSVEDQERNLLTNMSNVIIEVDGISDRKMIVEWLRAISPKMMLQLVETMETTNNWGISVSKQIECKDCGELYTVDLPINPINFFTA